MNGHIKNDTCYDLKKKHAQKYLDKDVLTSTDTPEAVKNEGNKINPEKEDLDMFKQEIQFPERS